MATDVTRDATIREEDPEAIVGLSEPERLARQRQQHEARLVRAKTAIRKGLVIVNTGNGKGKTTAAVGLLVRAWGQGLRVCMFQFIKAHTAKFGEIKAIRRFDIAVNPTGKGFTWMSKDITEDQELARAGWEACRTQMLSGEYDLIVLDEFTYPLKYGWIAWDEVRAAFDARPAGMHLIITGRYATPELVAYADTVTEMTEVKHHYRAGIKLQRGIEF